MAHDFRNRSLNHEQTKADPGGPSDVVGAIGRDPHPPKSLSGTAALAIRELTPVIADQWSELEEWYQETYGEPDDESR